MSRLLIRLLSLLVALSLVQLRAQAPAAPPDITDLQTSAYLAIMNGDKARDAEQLPEAVKAYQEALKGYQRIQQLDPAYKPKIIDYRLAYCANQLKDLQARMAKQENPEVSSARAALKDLQLRYQALESDAEALRRQSVAAREKEQAALARAQQAEAAAAQAAEALRKLGEDKTRAEQGVRMAGEEKQALLDAAKAAELKALNAAQEAEAHKAEAARLAAEVKAKPAMDPGLAAKAAALEAEVVALRKAAAEAESAWQALGSGPDAVNDRIRTLTETQTTLREQAVRLAGENEKLRHDLDALTALKADAAAMTAQRLEFEKALAVAAQREQDLGAEVEKSRGETAAAQEALRALQEAARGGAEAVSNLTARLQASQGETARLVDANAQLEVRIRELDAAGKEAADRAAASLAEQQAIAARSVRTVEENIAFVKSVRDENERLAGQLKVSENLRADLERMLKEAEQMQPKLAAADQAVAQAKADLEAARTAVAGRDAEIQMLRAGEAEFRKTVDGLRALLTACEKELQALREAQAVAPGAAPAPVTPGESGEEPAKRKPPPLPRNGGPEGKPVEPPAAPPQETPGDGN